MAQETRRFCVENESNKTRTEAKIGLGLSIIFALLTKGY